MGGEQRENKGRTKGEEREKKGRRKGEEREKGRREGRREREMQNLLDGDSLETLIKSYSVCVV